MSPHESEKYSPVAVGSAICAKPVRLVTSSWNLGKSISLSRLVVRRDVELADGVPAGDRTAMVRLGVQDLVHQRMHDHAYLRMRAHGLLERTAMLSYDIPAGRCIAIRDDALFAQDLRHFVDAAGSVLAFEPVGVLACGALADLLEERRE